MKNLLKIISVIIGGFWCAYLFDGQSIGLNLPLFGIYVLIISFVFRKADRPGLLFYIVLTGWMVTSFFTVYFNSALAICMNIISLVFLCGLIHASKIRSLVYGFLHAMVIFGLSVPKFFAGPFLFFRNTGVTKSKRSRISLAILLIVLVLILFTTLFASSNPVFNDLVNKIFGNFFNNLWNAIKQISFLNIHLFILGALVCTVFCIRIANNFFGNLDSGSNDNIYRKRRKPIMKRRFPARKLRNENRFGVALMLLLNILILIFNVIDVKWVWFDFVWNGDYLKPFVHNGTFILIFTILLSITMVLLFFRKNLNYYSKAKTLKVLVYIWLFQNMVVATSVGMRTVRYIQNFNLAYLRIGIFFFLLAVMFGLITVFIKIYKRKSAYYLLRKNVLFIFCGLCLMTTFNWNRFIAVYNVQHSSQGYFHRDYMVCMPDNVLPVLLANYQLLDYPFVNDYYSHEYVYSEYNIQSFKTNYLYLLEDKLTRFTFEYPFKSWQSWNYADYLAYKEVCIQVKNLPVVTKESYHYYIERSY